MKRKIRRGTFETNSSSTHAICITKSDVKKCDLSKNVTFTHGEFGWEVEEYYGLWEKASYLYRNSPIKRQKRRPSLTTYLSCF